ncbi:MAG: hypothetical protein ACFHVJ_20990 [Aestuariibacter sp.]
MSELPISPVDNLDVLRELTTEPMLVVKPTDDSLNHSLVYLNIAFAEQLGWELQDIPDKNTWWLKAYPEPDYRHAVEQHWELLFQDAVESGDSNITLEVNIMTKHRGLRRFKVTAEIESRILMEHYVVLFSPIETNVT